MDKFRRKQQKSCGVGGMHCDCCNKFKGKDRSELNRTARARLKVEDLKDVYFLIEEDRLLQEEEELEDEDYYDIRHTCLAQKDGPSDS